MDRHDFWRTSDEDAGLLGRLLTDKYRLSSSAAVLGIGGGTLYAVQGNWTYTNFLRGEAASWLGSGPARPQQPDRHCC